ncbi:hypothetical protein PJIAN_2178 [Paludibacter jiangxiensis]|uniref:Uncharacterized protein n=1 Tax=Paludibacter jiangxiensis TaxID=681398 RepID=A0A161LUG7_9BACT|nr:hypothetical protein PJIAN_2178 [Paludibacter jiangxiensis]
MEEPKYFRKFVMNIGMRNEAVFSDTINTIPTDHRQTVQAKCICMGLI